MKKSQSVDFQATRPANRFRSSIKKFENCIGRTTKQEASVKTEAFLFPVFSIIATGLVTKGRPAQSGIFPTKQEAPVKTGASCFI